MSKPQPPPEAVLIRLTREAAHIRTPDAARQAGVSTARWSHIENGYETRPGGLRPVRGRAVTIAHMAHAVGVEPGRLEGSGRADAAVILREILRTRPSAQLPPGSPDVVREHWADPDVRKLWGLSVTEDQRLSLIAALIESKNAGRPGGDGDDRMERDA